MRNTTLNVRMCLPKSDYSVSKTKRGNYFKRRVGDNFGNRHIQTFFRRDNDFLWISLKYWYLFGILGLSFTAAACCHRQFCSNPNNTFATTKIQIQSFWTNINTAILEESKQYVWNNENKDSAILNKQKYYNIGGIQTIHLQQRKYNYSNFEQTKIVQFCSNPNNKFETKKIQHQRLRTNKKISTTLFEEFKQWKKIYIPISYLCKLKTLQY